MDSEGRRRSSASSVDREKLTRLREMKLFNQGGIASKLFRKKSNKAQEAKADLFLIFLNPQKYNYTIKY